MGGGRNLFLKYWRFLWLSLCVIGLSLGTSGLLYAQQDDSDEFTLEEIIVTAEKREAELQKIPLDIDVVRPDQMLNLNVNQVYDLAKILPDVSVQASVGSFVLLSIREVQTVQFNNMFETTVATHINGVQLTRFGGLEGHFFDLERVEVLKGPQGTLYGRGSTAGSMNIITQKPVIGEFSGHGEIELGNYAKKRATAAVNVPLTDNLAMRVAGRYLKQDGYSDVGYQDQDTWSGRMSFRWEPNDNATFTVIGDMEQYENNGYPMGGLSPTTFYFDTYGEVTIVENTLYPLPPYTNGGPVYTPWQTAWSGADLSDNYNDFSSYGITAIMDYDVNFAYLTFEYGHRSQNEAKHFYAVWPGSPQLVPYPYNLTGIPGPAWAGTPGGAVNPPPYTEVALHPGSFNPALFTATKNYGDTDSFELRLTSKTTIPAGDPLEWIIGAYKQRDKISTETYPSTWAPNYWNLIDSTNEAIFAQASWMPIDKWNLTGGARWSWDYKDATIIWRFDPAIGNVPFRDHSYEYYSGGLFGNPSPTNTISDTSPIPVYSWSEPTYKINLSYIPTNDIMTYLQFSKGYRTGNVDFQGFANNPEYLNSWELGFKSRWMGNKLQFNSTIYYYDYKNYNTWDSPSVCTGNVEWNAANNEYQCEDVAGPALNPGEPPDPNPDGAHDVNDQTNMGYTSFAPGGAEQMGISVGLTWLVTMNDTVTVTGSWRHNEYGDGYDMRAAILAIYPKALSYLNSASADQSGREFGGAPIRANASYNHTFYIGKDVLTAGGTLFYEGDGIDQYVNYGAWNQYTMPGRDAYYTIDVNASYTSSRWMPAGMMWNVRFVCNNVLDDDSITSISYSDNYNWNTAFPNFYPTQDVYPTGSGVITSYSTVIPRTYSITFGINW